MNTKTGHKIAYFLQDIIFGKAVSTETESPILINTYMHCILITKLNNPYIKKLTLLDSFTLLIIIIIVFRLTFHQLSGITLVLKNGYISNFSFLSWRFYFLSWCKKNPFDFIGITQASNILTGKERQFEINICLTESIPKLSC